MGVKEVFAKAKNERLLGKKDEKFEKLKIFIYDEERCDENGMVRQTKSDPVYVQFNPSEYTISRGVKVAGRPGMNQDSNGQEVRAIHGEPATLRIGFYFDTWSDFGEIGISDLINVFKSDVPGGTKNKMKNLLGLHLLPNAHKDPQLVADMLMSLLKFEPKSHQPAVVELVWGSLDFLGKVTSCTANYTMFSPKGTPVRAKVDLTVVGEETGLAKQIMQFPPQSPDRTKERTMLVGDQLWMVASNEYNDPAMWRVIADANGILNPRAVDKTMSLKVPSIK